VSHNVQLTFMIWILMAILFALEAYQIVQFT
jgi:hypothetical protein